MTDTPKITMEKSYFSKKMKLAELIDINFNLLHLLPRLGVSLSLGAQSVAVACQASGLDVETFLLICNVYTYDEYVPSVDTLKKASVEDIVKYLHASHSYYLESSVVALENDIATLLDPCSDKQKAIIWQFFSQYKAELGKHFAYEEEKVFPYVHALVSGKVAEGFSISQFEDNHTNIGEKLTDLKNIVMMYLPSDCDNTQRAKVLLVIYQLEEDLERHTRIEDQVLVPMVNRIEEDGR